MNNNELILQKCESTNVAESTEINNLIDEMTLFEDDLMSRVFNKNIPATELLLRIILQREVKVIDVKTQVSIKNTHIHGRSIIMDIVALDVDGSQINVEVQSDSKGSHVKRARYHSSMLDTVMLKKNKNYKKLKDSYVIFIYKRDKFRKGLPIYHVDRFVDETRKPFKDGSHIIYVNGNYKGTDDIGKLIHDFKCKNVTKMHYKELADGVKYYKEKEGREEMGELVEAYARKRAKREALKASQRGLKNLVEVCKELTGSFADTVEQLMKKYNLDREEAERTVKKYW